MVSKDEYYQRIIASLQADISSQDKAISDLKSNVDRQQKEIVALKASQDTPQISSEHPQERISTEHLLLAVKRVCDDVIRANYEQLPTMFADRQQFESFRRSAEQKFLSVETFTGYKKSLEARLKSIEEKLGRNFSILTINRNTQKDGYNSKSYFNLDTIISIIKNANSQWVIHILVSLFIGMLAVYLLKSITI